MPTPQDAAVPVASRSPASDLLCWMGSLVFLAIGADATLYHWESTLTSPGIERAYFQKTIASHELDYLYGLRDTHLGCKTLAYRDPDLVLLGDSHTYAGYDYPLLQRELGAVKVGSCALAGMFPENAEDFLRVVATGGLSTRFVVFGIQPRMFWDVPERRDRIVQARRQINEILTPKESLPALLTGRWRQIDPFLGTASTARQKTADLEQHIAALDERLVDRLLDTNVDQLYALKNWVGFVNDGGPYGPVPEVVSQVCRAVRAAHVHLGVVYIPESRWLNGRYTTAQRAQFKTSAEFFNACADWVDLSAFEANGYENKYFVNRSLVDNYPYDGWMEPRLAFEWIAQKPDERRWQLFDPDHMTSVGAQAFSVALAPRLRQWRRGVN